MEQYKLKYFPSTATGMSQLIASGVILDRAYVIILQTLKQAISNALNSNVFRLQHHKYNYKCKRRMEIIFK